MALTRKFLSALGIDPEKIDEIISAHTETIDGLKADRDKYKADAEKLETIQGELEKLKEVKGYKEKYEKEHKDFEDFKAGIAEKESKSAKEAAVKAYFESKNIHGKNLEIAMRGSAAEIAGVEIVDGKIKDATALDSLVKDTFSGLVQTTQIKGANTYTPPANGASGTTTKTRAEIMAIKDTDERQRAIAENPSLFGL